MSHSLKPNEHGEIQKIEAAVGNMEKTVFYRNFVKQMQSPEISSKMKMVLGKDGRYSKLEMVFYGLGSFVFPNEQDPNIKEHWCRMSRWQLALAILLKRNSNLIDNILFYDPALTSLEIQILRRLGFAWIPNNEEGKRKVERPTLFFIPHCDLFLYNNVLEANWNPQSLKNIIILGNSFTEYKNGEGPLGRQRPQLPVNKWIPRYPLSIMEDNSTSEFPLTLSDDDNAVDILFTISFLCLSWHFFGFRGNSSDLDRVLKETTTKALKQLLHEEKNTTCHRRGRKFEQSDVSRFVSEAIKECDLDPSKFHLNRQCHT